MKRLNYLDYIKTPNDWKLKALDIPNQSQSKEHRPSAMLIALAVVISLSGVGVFAVESDAIDILKRKLLDDTYTPYSYSGNYDTEVYVKKAHPVLTSSFTIIIKVPATIGSVRLNIGITPVKNILTKHNAEIIPPRATL